MKSLFARPIGFLQFREKDNRDSLIDLIRVVPHCHLQIMIRSVAFYDQQTHSRRILRFAPHIIIIGSLSEGRFM